MKAMVLAAGLGLRMRPLTLLAAKPVLPVLDRPLVATTLERLARAGVRDVVVNLHHLPESVTGALGRGGRFGLRIRYAHEPEILGTGGGPRAVRELLGTRRFLLVNGDVLFDFDLRALVARHDHSGAVATLALRPQPDAHAYSAVVTQRGRIRSIAGRPRPAAGALSMFTGVHVLDPGLLERLAPGPSDSVRDLYVPLLAEAAHVAGVRCAGAWYDFGRPALYRDAQLRMLAGCGRAQVVVGSAARIAATARVARSVLGSRSRVAAGASVERSVLWPGAVIEQGARVARSIVTTDAVVRAGERASGVIVLPLRALAAAERQPFDRRGEMAWVPIE